MRFKRLQFQLEPLRFKLIRLTRTDLLLFYVLQYYQLEEEIHERGCSVSANMRRKNENNAWISYNLYFWAGYKEHPN